MSHFETVRTKITDKAILIKALGMQPDIKEVKEHWFIRGYNSKCAKGEIVAIMRQGDYDLGYSKLDGVYYMIGDLGMGGCYATESGNGLEGLSQAIIATYGRLLAEDMATKAKSLGNVTVRIQ